MLISLILTNLCFLSIIVFLKVKNTKYKQIIDFKMQLDSEYKNLLEESIVLKTKLAEANTKIEYYKESKEQFKLLESDLLMQFKALSSDIITKNTNNFLNMANNELKNREIGISAILSPIKDILIKFDEKIDNIEKVRFGTYEALNQQLKTLSESQKELKNETVNLSNALRSPNVRGKWGEVQLRRLLEVSGMLNHIDFVEQPKIEIDNEEFIRPDVLINMPDNRVIIIDAKTPFIDYAKAMNETDPDVQKKCLDDFIKKVRDHINSLSKKKYTEHIKSVPDFVIMFIPSESLFSTALKQDPNIIEMAIEKNIILAAPSTLLAMLHVLAMSWRQSNISQNINEIVSIGKNICSNLDVVEDLLCKIGKHLKISNGLYHQAMSKFEQKVLINTKEFKSILNNTINDKIL